MKSWGWPTLLLLGGWLVLGLAGCLPPPYKEMPPPPPPPAPAPPPAMSRPILYVNANRLNLRACPGMDCPRISVLERNEEVEKVGEAADWFQVRVKRDGRMGWGLARHLSPTPAAPEAPLPTPWPAPPTAAPPPEKPAPPAEPDQPKPPVAEKAKPPAGPKKKAEERPGKPTRPAEAGEPPAKPKPPAEKPTPPPEKPTPPAEPEQPKKIRIM